MVSNDFIRNLSRKAAQLFPGAHAMQQDAERRLYELFSSTFRQLNLVSREEFDAQQAVLERASRSIAELEAKVAELEQQVEPARDGDAPNNDRNAGN